MKYLLIAGESSGDLHASRLIAEIKRLDTDGEFRFFGGDLMAAAAGHDPDLHCREMNVMGFMAVIKALPRILSQLNHAKRLIKEFRPDRIILVDYPSFNLRLAKYSRKLGLRTDWYISPKLWAWKEWRVKTFRKCVDHLLCILPFEPDFFRRHGYDRASYVGNPSVSEISEFLAHISPMKYMLERSGISDTRPVIALLPGSRKTEIASNLPLMLEVARRYPDFQYIVAAAPNIPEKFYREVAQESGLKMVFGNSLTLIKYAKAALVTSGTATLETALIGTPQVVCYRANGSRLSYKIMSAILKVKYVSLPNLITNTRVVPELLLNQCTAENISRCLSPLLQPSPKRDWQLNGYRNMRRKLGTLIASERAAEIITEK